MMDLVRLMLVTQTNFMSKRIHNKKHAKSFEDTMLSIIKVSSDYNDFESFRKEFELIRVSLSSQKTNIISSFFDEKQKYVNLALELTEDILNSIDSRFVSGGCRAYLELFEVKGEIC